MAVCWLVAPFIMTTALVQTPFHASTPVCTDVSGLQVEAPLTSVAEFLSKATRGAMTIAWDYSGAHTGGCKLCLSHFAM